MKKTHHRIFAAIVSNPFAYARFKLLGRELSSYATIGLRSLDTAVFDCEREIVFPEGYDFYAVVYEDMPLISADVLCDTAAYMAAKGYGRVSLGRGVMATERGLSEGVSEVLLKKDDFLSVNDTKALSIVYNILRKRIINRCLDGGAIILGDGVAIDDTAQIDEGAIIEGASAVLGNSVVSGGARIISSRVEDSKICKNATVGPFSYVRMGSVIGEGCRIGDFVEVKNSLLGAGVKSAHLSYIGDAEVGDKTNIGCGTVFCNYDGKKKHRATVGQGVFIGANTNLVAPVNIGDNAFIAAATTVTEDVSENEFCIGRVRQSVKPRKK